MKYIYSILNTVNYKVYVGQTGVPKNRWSAHKCEAKSGRLHYPIHRAIRKYGVENFQFSIIEICDDNEVDELEKFWIKEFDSRNYDMGYNLAVGGNVSSGWHHTEESKKKISESNMGKKMPLHTEEWKQHMSDLMTGRKFTNEWKQKISEAHKGKNVSDITKQKLSEYHAGQTHSDVTKEKMSKSHLGKKKSEETRQRMSETQRGDNSSRAKLSEVLVKQIIEEYATGEFTQIELSEKYDVTRSCIDSILNNRSWKHLDRPIFDKTLSDKSREKMSKSHFGKKMSQESKDKMSRAKTGKRYGAKLNWEKVDEIRKKYSNGFTKKELSVEYGVSENNIYVIVTNRSWVK